MTLKAMTVVFRLLGTALLYIRCQSILYFKTIKTLVATRDAITLT